MGPLGSAITWFAARTVVCKCGRSTGFHADRRT